MKYRIVAQFLNVSNKYIQTVEFEIYFPEGHIEGQLLSATPLIY